MKATAPFLGLMLCCLGVCWGAEWVELGQSSTGNIEYLDVSSLKDMRMSNYPYKPVLSYWVKVLYKNPKLIPKQDVIIHGHKVWYSLNQYASDCSGGLLHGPFQVLYYGFKNETLGSEDYPDNQGTFPAPETVGEGLLNTTCNFWKWKKDQE